MGDIAGAVWSLSDAELISRLDEVFAQEQALAAQRLALISEIDRRGLAVKGGAACIAVWLRHRLRLDSSAARQTVLLAQSLDKALPNTAQALAGGQVHVEQARVIGKAIAALPREIGPKLRDEAERALVDYASQFCPAQLGRLGERILEHVAPDVAERHEREQLRRGEARAWHERAFSLTPHGPGRVRLSGCLDCESAATVSAAIESLCSPTGAKSTAAHRGKDSTATHGGKDTTADDRNPAQRRADALVQLCRMALSGGELPVHGGQRPQVMVLMPFEPWQEKTTEAVGELGNGQRVSPETVRRMACDAEVIPVVLGGAGQPLDVGRQYRLVTAAIRKALNVRDRGCCFPGCDRPLSWCEAHHVVPWVDGGVTSLDNMALLCRPHHRLVHEGDWQVRVGSDRRPEFIPPSYVDPARSPRRNHYHPRT